MIRIKEEGVILRKSDLEFENEGEVLILTSYPPRVCGIATYSQELVSALKDKFCKSMSLRVCALEEEDSAFSYPGEVKYVLNTSISAEYEILAQKINNDISVKVVLIQHDFSLFRNQDQSFMKLLQMLSKPVSISFHTILSGPDNGIKTKTQNICDVCKSIIVMTRNSAEILINEYNIPSEKIRIIPHGTHLVQHLNKGVLKEKYNLKDHRVLSTFGLLSSEKSIETTLEALPLIVKTNPDVVFLILGITHPEVVKSEGEIYRQKLEALVVKNKLSSHVVFADRYLPLPELLEYLQLTDIYLLTANNPKQTVSGTFVYAMSCSCPIISTPLPHARELLTKELGIIIEFGNYQQLAEGVIRLLNDEPLRENLSLNTLQKIVSTNWENSAILHARLLREIAGNDILLQYNLPAINLRHFEKLTTDFGMIQYSKMNQPDISSGFTLDDNVKAMIAMCMNYTMTGDAKSLGYIQKYLNFIRHCQQPGGNFLNYVVSDKSFSDQNYSENLEDANGRAIWALGYLISMKETLPNTLFAEAIDIMQKTIPRVEAMYSTRAMAFAIKGLYYYHTTVESEETVALIKTLTKRLSEMYKHVSDDGWDWFEEYLTYANSIMPEAMLYAWLITGDVAYKDIAIASLNFLLNKIFKVNGIRVISNRGWLKRGQKPGEYGEQPIDVAYTIITLCKFYDSLMEEEYYLKIKTAFSWFLGNNRLNQIIYNPGTGGCFDGLEKNYVNMNQGAESTVSYLIARLAIEKYINPEIIQQQQVLRPVRKNSIPGRTPTNDESSNAYIRSILEEPDKVGYIGDYGEPNMNV